MKSKHLTRRKQQIALLAFSVFMHACAPQEEEINPNSKTGKSIDILTFADYQEFVTQSNEYLSKTPEEIASIEMQKGFISFGRMADEVYERAVTRSFNSIEEIELFAKENSDFVEILSDEAGEKSLERRLSDKRYRYFINTEKLFQIGETVYKVFPNKVVNAHISDIKKLKSISESDLEATNLKGISISTELRQKTSSVSPLYCSNVTTFVEDSNASGSERVKLKLYVQSSSYSNNMFPQPIFYNIGSYLEAKGQKKTLGIWFDAQRTITARYNAMVDYNFGSGWDRACFDQTFQTNGPQWSLAASWFVISNVNTPNPPQFHFSGYNSWADTPAPSPATVTCNLYSFCGF
ncbi:MAG: hypothetical protein ACMVP2_08720 [Imperialibacter sp.]|uniref:hypothetical protein n=1 Tax=Imperialibacter sp. TaxID=2038411 RepID=UPI003A86CF3F